MGCPNDNSGRISDLVMYQHLKSFFVCYYRIPNFKCILSCSNICFKAFEYFTGLDLFSIPSILTIFSKDNRKKVVCVSVDSMGFLCLILKIKSGLFNFLTFLDYILEHLLWDNERNLWEKCCLASFLKDFMESQYCYYAKLN